MNEPDAFVVLNDISNYYFCLLLLFWHRLSQHINRVQLQLQDPSIDFRDAASDISGLKDELHQEHNCNAFSGIEQMVIEGKELAEKMELDKPRMCQKKIMSRRSDSRRRSYCNKKDESMYRSIFIRRRQEVLQTDNFDKKFGFLLDVKMNFLMETAPVWLKEKCDYFPDQYSEVDGNEL